MIVFTQVLSRVDLNLLVALQVLLEERNVTRAAGRLFITQPAMSKTLQRLREAFDDPLFTRAGRELVPTPRALDLGEQLPPILAQISSMIEGDSFDPSRYEGVIRIATPAFIAVYVVPALTRTLLQEAPGLRLAVSGEMLNYQRDLSAGDLDFAFDLQRDMPDGLVSTVITEDEPVVWMRNDHPLSGQDPLVLSDMLEYPFVQYYMRATDPVNKRTGSRFDKTLESMGLRRRRALVTNQMTTAMETLRATDCLMLGTSQGVGGLGEFYEVVKRPYPPDVKADPVIRVVLVEHERTGNSPVHRWIKRKLLEVVENAKGGLPPPR